MDAAKALLGARRFGANRTPSSYRFTGRAGSPARKRAYVNGFFEDVYELGYPEGFTVTMEVASKRMFLVRQGDHLIRDRDQIPDQIEALRKVPRSAWLRPGEYQDRFLEKMGIGPASRRFLELPQGELSRVLDRDNTRLTRLMLELSSGKEASEEFEKATAALEEARVAQDETERAVERARAKLARLALKQRDATQAERLRAQLGSLLARAKIILQENPAPGKETPRSYLFPASRAKALGLAVENGIWTVPESKAGEVAGKLGAGESLPLAGADRANMITGPPIEKESPVETIPPRTRSRIAAAINDLKQAGVDPGEPVNMEPDELNGALAALMAAGVPGRPGEIPDLEPLKVSLAADERDLEQKTEILNRAVTELNRAKDVYSAAAEKALQVTAERFRVLCDEAGMAGRMEVLRGHQGVNVEIMVAEEKEGEMRPLSGSRNSLSGGWRATVIVFALIACLGGKPSMLLIDEVGSSLDEERLGVLGHAFRKLGERTGAFTMITIPSKTMSQTVGAFAAQQIAFFRPLASEPMAPPPHVIQKVTQPI